MANTRQDGEMDQPKIKKWLVMSSVTALVIVIALYSAYLERENRPPPASGIFATDPVWTLQVEPQIVSSIIADEERAFIRTTRGIIAVDIRNGEHIWSVDLYPRTVLLIPPVMTDDTLLVAEGDGAVSAFDPADGTLLWRQCGICQDYAPVSSIVYSQYSVYVARQNDQIAAYEQKTGRIQWQAGNAGRSLPELLLGESVLYAGSLYSIEIYDLSNGKELPTISFEPEFVQTLLLENEVMYLMLVDRDWNRDYRIIAYDIESGETLWQTAYSTEGNYSRSLLTLHNKTLYVAGGTLILALDAQTGESLWEFRASDLLDRALLAGDNMIVTRTESEIIVLDNVTGMKIGEMEITSSLGSDVNPSEMNAAVSTTTIIVPVTNHWVHAYSLSD